MKRPRGDRSYGDVPRRQVLLLALALGGAAAALVFGTLTGQRTNRALQNGAEAQRHAYDVLAAIRLLRQHVGEARVGQSGYVLTRSPAYRQTYESAVAGIAGDTLALRRLTRGQESLEALLDSLAPLLAEYVDGLGSAIRAAAPGAPRLTPALTPPEDVLLLRRLRPVILAMEAEEWRLMHAGRAAVEASVGRSRVVIAWTLIAGLALVAGAGGAVLAQLLARGRAEARERHTQRLFWSILNSTSDAIYVKDLDGRYELLNPAGAAALGVNAEAMLGKDDTALLDPPSAVAEMERDRAVFATGVTSTLDEVATSLATGETRHWHSTKGVVRDERGQPVGIWGISRDITERQRLERRLEESQRLEAIGRLAGGVAHDFNNILAAIVGFAEMLALDLPDGDPRRSDVKEILAAADRARDLTKQLLAFSRRQVLEARVVDLSDVARGVKGMLDRLIPENIEVVWSLASEPGYVSADPGQLEQVLVNLAVNARDAMPGGGRLVIETRHAELDAAYSRGHEPVQPGPYAMLAVSDTGSGMDQETQRRIFEPFFTTKEKERGTGLGLATVYGVVKQSGGYVWVYSEPGRGTTFKVYLPRVSEAPDPEPVAAPKPTGEWGGTETILVVEDDDAVRQVAVAALQRKGYTVLDTRRPESALALLVAHGQPIHLLISDIVLPEMSGPDLAREAAARAPGIRVLYQSGYSDLAIGAHGAFESGAPFLQKPYSLEELGRKVREVLDRP